MNNATTTKKILFDTFELVHGYGKSLGVYRHAVNLFRGMVESIPEGYELILVCNSLNKHDFIVPSPVKNCQVRCIKIDKMSSIKKLFWEWFGVPNLAKNLNADIYYSPKGFAPGFLTKPSFMKIVLTVHDMIPLWYAKRGIKGGIVERYVVWALQRSAKWADAIMADSNTTRLEIEKYCGSRKNVHVVYCGMKEKADISKERPLESEYLFAIGSSHPHKNIDTLLKAYSLYKEKTLEPLSLVICTRTPVPEGVIAVSDLTDDELQLWYEHAKCFIFPSLIEGFGFPPLEAMQNGAPVIAADTPIQREILGNACLYFDPLSAVSLKDQIGLLLGDNTLRKKLLQMGEEQWQRYTWRECRDRAWAVFKNCNWI